MGRARGAGGLLPQAVGLRRAREMSFTGRFVGAEEAYRIGLVNHVVPHQQLVPFAQRLAGEVAAIDPSTVQAINATYRDVAATTLGEGLDLERRRFADWKLSPADVEARRQAVIDRGRSKLR